MPTKSGKIVEKSVQKSAQKTWKKIVQKCRFGSFTQLLQKSTLLLQNFIDKFCTKNLCNSPLLWMSFTPFPHRTINTITKLNNKDF